MKLHTRWFGLLAALHSAAAAAQAAPQAPQSPPPQKAPGAGRGEYRSPFAGYRPFRADEPLQDWRAANEAVREAGGHVGIVKAGKAEGPAAGPHSGHGAAPRPPGGKP